MEAKPHPKQAERLLTLHNYDILDTPREADFDEIVALASKICETPISVVNLIDEHRQWFKAEVGLGVRETPLETSLCSHVLLENSFVEIPDTLLDPRMSDNPLCLAQDGLRFYAGAQLTAPNGLPIGTLCVLDTKPRTLSDLQRETLRVLSKQVMKLLDLRLTLHNQTILLSEIDHRVKNSLQSVSSIIRIHRRAISDPDSLTAFDSIERKVQAISMLHEQLQNNGGTEGVPLDQFLERVVALNQDTTPENIRISMQAVHAVGNSKTATGIGIVVSEFIANAVKHAFPDGQPGNVTIHLANAPDGSLELTCKDDGVGSNLTEVDGDREGGSRGLGRRLMQAAASQIGATMENVASREGYTSYFRFNG